MELGLAPWTLPIDTLRWGRWTSATRSAIWIVWEGPHPLRIAFLDGVRTGDVTIHPGAVDVGGARLTVSDDAMITNATLGEQLGVLAPLRSLVEKVAGSRQTRWRARGSLCGQDGRDEVGWVV